VDQEQNLYLAAVGRGGVQKFRPRQGANPAYLVGKHVLCLEIAAGACRPRGDLLPKTKGPHKTGRNFIRERHSLKRGSARKLSH